MGNMLNIKEKIEEISKNAYLEVSNSWGHKYAGYKGIIITKNDEVYKYQEYYQVPPSLGEEESNFFVKIDNLSKETKNEIEKYISENIKNKEFEEKVILDVGFTVKIHLENEVIEIKNYKNINDDLTEIINKNE